MSGRQFAPGKKGNLSKLLRNLYYCQSRFNPSSSVSDSDTDPFNSCRLYENCFCIQEKVNQIKSGYNDPTQPLSFRVAQLANQRLGGRTTFGNVGLGLGIGVNARISTEGQPGGSPRPLRNKF
jgi:hypothetical protein